MLLNRRIAIVGIGATAFRPVSPELSYKELLYEAAARAYADAGIDPRRDVDSFVTLAEDYAEGTSIFDEYTPDQIGGALRPVHTITADGLFGVAAAVMQLLTGQFDTVVVAGHSKASNLLTPHHVTAYALDPVYVRPLGFHPHAVAGMEMARYLHESGANREACAHVAAKNRRNALLNPLAAYPADLKPQELLRSPLAFAPLTEAEVARPADGAVVLVLASEEAARRLSARPVWVLGAGWATDSPDLATCDWGPATYCRLAAEMAYKQAGITDPSHEIQLAEVDDTFAYKELQHLEALGLCGKREAARLTLEGATGRGGRLPVNVSGGSLGMGHLGEATGLARLMELVLQLRGQAGPRQVEGVRTAVAQSWRGVPTATGAVLVVAT
jgi:acetyl-CoA C-acetyltransferase